jgi:hypothetical protein
MISSDGHKQLTPHTLVFETLRRGVTFPHYCVSWNVTQNIRQSKLHNFIRQCKMTTQLFSFISLPLNIHSCLEDLSAFTVSWTEGLYLCCNTLFHIVNVLSAISILFGKGRLHDTKILLCTTFRNTRVYQKVSGLAAWSENCKWYSSLPLGATVSLLFESV